MNKKSKKEIFIVIEKTKRGTMKNITILILSIILTSCGNSEKATKFYLDAIKEFNNNNLEKSKNYLDLSIKEKSNFYQSHFLKAKILFLKKNFKDSEIIFSELAKVKKENFDCKLWLIRNYFFLKENSKAKQIINDLLKNNSEDWRLYYWKAQIAKEENDFESYFSNLNTAEQILKSSKDIYQSLAIIWNELGFSEKSSSYYKKINSLLN